MQSPKLCFLLMRVNRELGLPISLAENALKQRSSTFITPETSFVEDSFSVDQGWEGWFWDDSSILHLCALYIYYYSISSTLDHQALDSGGWDPFSGVCEVTKNCVPSQSHWPLVQLLLRENFTYIYIYIYIHTHTHMYIYVYTHIYILLLSILFTKQTFFEVLSKLLFS